MFPEMCYISKKAYPKDADDDQILVCVFFFRKRMS